MIVVWIVLGIAAVLLLWLLLTYNRLVRLRNFVGEAWSGHRRTAASPPRPGAEPDRGGGGLPGSRGEPAYAHHPKPGPSRNTRPARRASARPKASCSARSSSFSPSRRNYPDLKASDVYLNLQEDLTTVENELQMARRYYNGTVRNLNTGIQIFPNSLVAGWFRFREAEFFQIDEEARQAPQVGG